MAPPTLIYCAGGNPRLAGIAVAAGYRYGAQLPDTVYPVAPLYFADQDWTAPRREAYMAALAQHRPAMATVLDIEHADQLAEALAWAAEAADHVGRVVLVPKVDVIARLPATVGPADVVLGFSVPTRYGGTPLPLEAFAGRPVHLLGGTPHAQMLLWHRTRTRPGMPVVVSVDGNYHSRLATRHAAFWIPGTGYDPAWIRQHGTRPSSRFWPSLREAHGGRPYTATPGNPAYVEAFRRSCANIRAAWHRLDRDPDSILPSLLPRQPAGRRPARQTAQMPLWDPEPPRK